MEQIENTVEKQKFCNNIKNYSINKRQMSVNISLVFKKKKIIRISSPQKIFYDILQNILTLGNKKIKHKSKFE